MAGEVVAGEVEAEVEAVAADEAAMVADEAVGVEAAGVAVELLTGSSPRLPSRRARRSLLTISHLTKYEMGFVELEKIYYCVFTINPRK